MNYFNKFDAVGKDALTRVEDIANSIKLNELLKKRELEEKQKNCIIAVLAVIGAVAAVAAVAYAVYSFLAPDDLDDYEDDFEDEDFDDDFFEEDEAE